VPAAPVPVDVEAGVAGWLRDDLGAGHRVVTEAPADLAGAVPVFRVVRLGGGDRDVVLDRATVDVDTWAADRGGARAAALDVHARLRFALPGQRIPGGVVCQVDTLTGPAWRPWDDTAVRRFGATYVITVQAQT
jgi:hypothetical protein